jgi:hypothetical protein
MSYRRDATDTRQALLLPREVNQDDRTPSSGSFSTQSVQSRHRADLA